MMPTIGIIAEYNSDFAPHVATTTAIDHSCGHLSCAVRYEWISSEDIHEGIIDYCAGFWIAPGSPYRNLLKTLWLIRQARDRNIPVFGTCGGFQHIMLEYARNELRIQEATHAEYDPYASELFISSLECSLAGREMDLTFVEGSRVQRIYESQTAKEQYYCNFSVNPADLDRIKSGSICITGSDSEDEVRVVEYPDKEFFTEGEKAMSQKVQQLVAEDQVQINSPVSRVWDVIVMPEYIRQWDDVPENFEA